MWGSEIGIGGVGEDEVLPFANFASFPATGESGKLYLDESNSYLYRWDGVQYVLIAGGLILGETSITAYRGDRGKTAYDHSQTAHAPSTAQENTVDSVAGKTGVVTLDKSDVGLGNVDNTADSAKPVSTAQQTAIDKAGSYWKEMTGYTATPASTSTITMSSDWTAKVNPGDGLRYTIGGVDFHGICVAITSTLLTVRGAPLSGDITNLDYTKIPVIDVAYGIAGEYSGSTIAGMLENYLNISGGWRWKKGKVKFVGLDIASLTDDLTTQATIQVVIGGSNVLTSELSLPDGGNETKSGVNISTTHYDVNNGDIIDIDLTAGDGGAVDLVATFIFVPVME